MKFMTNEMYKNVVAIDIFLMFKGYMFNYKIK